MDSLVVLTVFGTVYSFLCESNTNVQFLSQLFSYNHNKIVYVVEILKVVFSKSLKALVKVKYKLVKYCLIYV